jgi:hypothetical protein
MESIIAYQKVAWRSSAYQDALDCIVDKCSLDLSKSMYATASRSGLSNRSYVGMSLILVGAAALAVLLLVRHRKGVGNKAQLLTKEGTYYGSYA